jgi:hypothetical protein
MAAACYHPSPQAGAPCARDGTCPAPLHCSAINTCEPADDAGGDRDAAVDAPRDAAHDAGYDAAILDAPKAPIAWKATTTQTIPVSPNAMAVTLDIPAFAPGDVMIAAIAMGNTGQAAAPVFTPPSGWTLISQVDKGNDSALAMYRHVAANSEPATVTWTFNELMEGVAWISDYVNVSTTTPIDVDSPVLINTTGPGYTAPSVTTSTAGAMLVVTYAVHGSTKPTWIFPSGTQTRADLDDGTTRRGVGVDKRLVAAGSSPTLTLTASVAQDYALIDVLALRPN